MSPLSVEEFDALTRLDFQVFAERVFAELNGATSYADNFHIGVICARLEALRRGEIKRLIINVPPRSLKSIIASVAFPAFLLGHEPTLKIVAASYGQELADALARDCRQVMQQEWYRRVFPKTKLEPSRQAVHAFETTAGGERLATSVGGPFTGFGGAFIIVDDPIKPSDALSDVERGKANEWFNHTMHSRLNSKVEGAVVVVMQRLHEDDFVAHILPLDDWEVLSFPAIAQEDEAHVVVSPHGSYVHRRAKGEALHPTFEPLESLEKTRKILGNAYFSAQYLQAPTAAGGNLIKEAWFARFEADSPPKFDKVIQSWDTSNKVSELNDYSVCTTWGVKGKHVYLIHVLRKKMEYPDLKRTVIQHANLYDAYTVLIEDRASGTQLYQDLRREGLKGVTAYQPKGDKILRMRNQTPAIEGGCVHLPHQAPWLADYLQELMAFPKSGHDDQVDSTAQALDYIGKPNDFEKWMKLLEMDSPVNEVPSIRVRYKHPGTALSTITGRHLYPDSDGIFLLTKEEWEPLGGAGFSLVE